MSTAGVVQEPMGVRDSRRLLVERAAVLLGRVFHSVGRGWSRWKKQAGRNPRTAHGGGLGTVVGAVMGRALTARGTSGRMLAVEERLTLGPKQHMYLIRCGEQRLLVASAGEAALQWMMLPDEVAQDSGEACGNTLVAAAVETETAPGVKTGSKATAAAKRGTGRSGAQAKRGAGSRSRRTEAGKGEMDRSDAVRAGAEGARCMHCC